MTINILIIVHLDQLKILFYQVIVFMYLSFIANSAPVAQMAERMAFNHVVEGSSPSWGVYFFEAAFFQNLNV